MREGRLRTQALALALCDALMVILAMSLAWWLRFDFNDCLARHGWPHPFPTSDQWTPFQPYVAAVFVALPVFWLILREMGLYAAPEDGTGEFLRLCAVALVASVLLGALGFYIKQKYADQQFLYSRGYMLMFLPCAVVCLAAGRKVFRASLRLLSARGIGQNRVLMVGAGPLAEELAAALHARGTNVIVGALTPPEGPRAGIESGAVFPLACLGGLNDLTAVAQRERCDEVIVAVPGAAPGVLEKVAEDCYRAHIRFQMVPDVYEMLLDRMDLSLVGDIPLLGMRGSRIEGINYLFKRLFDLVASFIFLVLLGLLVFPVIALLIKLSDGGPVFYYQERIGYKRRKFRFWKFRSMKINADSAADVERHKLYTKKYIGGAAAAAKDKRGRTVYKLTDDPRVTRVGRWLRKYSLDELPQLWNVLKGEMSLIGPRPPIAYEVENYRPIHLRRFEVLPGISGLWQVSGRNEVTFDEMVKLDLYYIENWSLELDVRILFKTLSVVLFQKAY